MILLRLTRIASEPTLDGLAELQQRDLQSRRKRSSEEGYSATGITGEEGEEADKDRADSLPRCSCVSMYTGGTKDPLLFPPGTYLEGDTHYRKKRLAVCPARGGPLVQTNSLMIILECALLYFVCSYFSRYRFFMWN